MSAVTSETSRVSASPPAVVQTSAPDQQPAVDKSLDSSMARHPNAAPQESHWWDCICDCFAACWNWIRWLFCCCPVEQKNADVPAKTESQNAAIVTPESQPEPTAVQKMEGLSKQFVDFRNGWISQFPQIYPALPEQVKGVIRLAVLKTPPPNVKFPEIFVPTETERDRSTKVLVEETKKSYEAQRQAVDAFIMKHPAYHAVFDGARAWLEEQKKSEELKKG